MAEKIEGKAHFNINMATDFSVASWSKAAKELESINSEY
jgi:hypothetical protein